MRQFSYILGVFIAASVLFHVTLIFFEPAILFEPEPIQLGLSSSGGTKMQIKLMESGQSDALLSNKSPNGQNDDFLTGDLDVDQEKWGDLLERLENNANLTSAFKQVYEDFRPENKTSRSYIYRDRRQEDIVVKEVFPTIYTIDKDFSEILNAAPKDLSDHNKRNEIIQEFRKLKKGKRPTNALKIHLSDEDDKVQKTPLNFPKEQRKEYFDETLVLAKEVQLNNFIRHYFSYDPNDGDLPIATRELYYDNLQRIAYIFSNDPTYFYLDYFLENLNKEDFLKNSLYQAATLDKTKTQTELLFAIEDIYHIQQRAWNYYFRFEDMDSKLPEERKNRLRNETLRRVHERYKGVLKDKGISNDDDILALYSRKRMEIMDYVINNSPEGYRKNDALFEQAFITWQEGIIANLDEKKISAIAQWLSISIEGYSAEAHADFLSYDALNMLVPLLKEYLGADQATQRIVQAKIQFTLTQRNQSKLVAKQVREERLLWPQ